MSIFIFFVTVSFFIIGTLKPTTYVKRSVKMYAKILRRVLFTVMCC